MITFKNLISCLLLLLLGSKAFGNEIPHEIEDSKLETKNDYDSNFYQDEGRVIFKLKGRSILSKSKQTGLPKEDGDLATSRKELSNFTSRSFGGELSAVVFFHTNFAAELSFGFDMHKVKSSYLNNIGNNYFQSYTITNPNFDASKPENNTDNQRRITVAPHSYDAKKKDIYGIPLTLLMQYHIAPFGGIRPYVGFGGHYTYLFTKSKDFEVRPGMGLCGQIGIDFVAKDDTFITLELKKYILKSKISYKESLMGKDLFGVSHKVSGKIALDPMVLSLGISFKF